MADIGEDLCQPYYKLISWLHQAADDDWECTTGYTIGTFLISKCNKKISDRRKFLYKFDAMAATRTYIVYKLALKLP